MLGVHRRNVGGAEEIGGGHVTCPITPLGRSVCAQELIDRSEPAGFTCPHGVGYWIEPTGEQISHWVETGTP